MPLGDSNAGAPNPALLQFLFSRQDARRKEARQQQLDQAAAVLAQQEAERKGQLHRLDVLTKMQGIRKDQGEFEESQVPRIDAAGQNIQQEITGLGNVMFPEDVAPLPPDPRNLVGTPLPGDQSFASLIQRDDPAGFAKIPQTAATRADINQRNYAPIKLSIRQRAAALSEAGLGDPEVLYEQMAEGVFSRSGEAEFLRKRELEKTKEGEERAAGFLSEAATLASNRRMRAATRLYDRSLEKEVGTIKAINEGLQDETDKVDDPNLSEKEQNLAAENVKSLRAEKLRRFVVNTPESFGRLSNERINARQDYRSRLSQMKVLDELIARPGLLGAPGTAARIIENLLGLGVDVKNVVNRNVATAINSGALDKADIKLLNNVFTKGTDEDGVQLERARQEEVRLLWSVLLAQNPSGRQLKSQVDALRKVLTISGLTLSSKVARNRLVSARNSMQESLFNLQNKIRDIEPEQRFDPDTFDMLGERPVVIVGFDDVPEAASTFDATTLAPEGSELGKQQREAADRIRLEYGAQN